MAWPKGIWQLIRIIPVLSWSGAGIMTTMLPILLFYDTDVIPVIFMMSYLFFGGICVQGLLAHALNDIMDDASGTDRLTTGILSGGSHILKSKDFSLNLLKKLALIMILLAIAVEAFLLFSGARLLATILVIGLWSAFSYSAPPFRLSYIPFLGEWLCAFPAITTLSVAPALLTFHQLPAWALENACIHGLWSLSWLMFHHISDVDADKRATPMKKTTVVLFDLRVKLKYRRKVPVLFYLLITFIVTFWLCLTRPFSGCVSSLFVLLAFYLVATSEIRKPAQHAKSEIGLIALSVVNAIWLGITPFY